MTPSFKIFFEKKHQILGTSLLNNMLSLHFQNLVLYKKLFSIKDAKKWYTICLWLKTKKFDHFAHVLFWKRVWKRRFLIENHGEFFSRDLYAIEKLWTKFQLYKDFFLEIIQFDRTTSNKAGLCVTLVCLKKLFWK